MEQFIVPYSPPSCYFLFPLPSNLSSYNLTLYSSFQVRVLGRGTVILNTL